MQQNTLLAVGQGTDHTSILHSEFEGMDAVLLSEEKSIVFFKCLHGKSSPGKGNALLSAQDGKLWLEQEGMAENAAKET